MQSVDVPFRPPLETDADAFSRLLSLGAKAMEAKWSWIVSEPICLTIVLVTLALGYTTLILGEDGLQTKINTVPVAADLMLFVFRSVRVLYRACVYSFYFAIVAHALEGVYVAHQIRTVLKRGISDSLKWFLVISCVGYPVTMKGMEFIQIANEKKAKKQM